jgi:hypothetical protein
MLDDDRSFAENLDAALAGQTSPRAWGRRIALLVATLVVGVLVFGLLVRDADTGSLIAKGAHYTIELSSDVTWGTFTITVGKVQTTFTNNGAPQISGIYSAPALLTISFVAPPFASTTCRLTLPPATHDTCRDPDPAALTPNGNGIIALAAHFRMTSGDLPSPTEQALLSDLDGQVLADTPRVGIPAGSHYAVGTLLNAHPLATQSLMATLLTARGDARHIPDRGCPALCGADVQQPTADPAGQQIWHARLYIDQQWRISDPAGTVLGSINESAVSRPLDVDLRYDPATKSGRRAVRRWLRHLAELFLRARVGVRSVQ